MRLLVLLLPGALAALTPLERVLIDTPAPVSTMPAPRGEFYELGPDGAHFFLIRYHRSTYGSAKCNAHDLRSPRTS